MSEVATAYVTLMPSARGFLGNLRRQIDPDTRKAGTSAGKSFGDTFKKGALGALRGVGKTLTAALGIGSIAVGSSILSGMTGQAVALAGGLAQAAGAAAVLPAALAGALSVVGALVIGMQGVGDAIKAAASGDAKQLNEALKGLAPSAQKFVRDLKDALPAIKGIKNAVQQNLFKGLGPTFGRALRDLGPIAQSGFAKIAAGLNVGLKSTFRQIDVPANLTGISTVFDNTARALHRAAAGAAPLVNSLVKFTSVGSAFLPRLGGAFTDLSKRAAAFIDRISSDGTLQRWIGTGMDLLSQLGRVIKNIGSILGSVLSAGAAQGRGLISSFEGMTAQLSNFLKSTDGQAALHAFFQSAAAGASLLGPLLKALAPIFTTVAGAIGPIAQQFGPVLVQILQALTPGINAVVAALGPFVAALSPTLVQIAGALSDVLVALAPALLPIAGLVNAIVDAMMPFVPVLVSAAGALGPLAKHLASIITFLKPVAPAAVIAFGAFKGAKAASDGVSNLKDKITGGIDAVKDFKDKISDGVQSVKDFGGQVKSGYETVKIWSMYAVEGAKRGLELAKNLAASGLAYARQGAAAALAGIRTAASTVASVAASVAAKAWAAAQWLLNAALSANPIGLVIAGIAALVAIFVVAWKKSETFRAIVTGAFNGVKIAAQAVANFFTVTLPAAFMKIVDGLHRAWNAVVGFIKTWGPRALVVLAPFIGIPLEIYRHFSAIKGYLTSAFNSALTTARNFVTNVGTAIAKLPGKLLGGLRSLKDAGAKLMGAIFDGLGHATGVVGDFAKAVVNKVIDGLNALIPHKLHIHIPIPMAPDVDINIPLVPNIPHLAKGGMTNGPMAALIGDNRGGNELVMPMESPRTVRMLAEAIRQAGGGASRAGGDTYHIYEATNARKVALEVGRYQSMAGRI